MGVIIAAVCILGFNLLQHITSKKSKQIEEAKKEVKVDWVRLSDDPHTKREGPNNTIRCSCGFVSFERTYIRRNSYCHCNTLFELFLFICFFN